MQTHLHFFVFGNWFYLQKKNPSWQKSAIFFSGRKTRCPPVASFFAANEVRLRRPSSAGSSKAGGVKLRRHSNGMSPGEATKGTQIWTRFFGALVTSLREKCRTQTAKAKSLATFLLQEVATFLKDVHSQLHFISLWSWCWLKDMTKSRVE